MTDPIDDPQLIRRGDAALLARALTDAREDTLRLFAALRAALGDALEVKYLEVINPPRWEIGHVSWFEEFWIARNTERLRGASARLEAPRAASLLRQADALYDSSQVAHVRRWHLDLPDAAGTLAYVARVREHTLNLLGASDGNDEALYFFRLALLHEAMHVEAGAMNAQTLGLDLGAALDTVEPAPVPAAGELSVPATSLTVGQPGGGFAFDNELGVHSIEVPGFTIDCAPISWAAYLPFIEAGGYDDAKAWTRDGWAWRRRELPNGLPRHVMRSDDGTLHRERFGHRVALDPQRPAMHLSQHEAQAWCRWAGRRLPTEHEWTIAIDRGGDGFAWGQVWEWTASPFEPWPGFTPHPYRDYSQPWFDGRPVLKGGSFATPPRMKHPRYRNFFQAGRNDVFAGFRSCEI